MNYKLIIVGLFLAVLLPSCEKNVSYQLRGEEVFPPVPIKYAALYRMDQLPISPSFFRDQWTWVNFGLASCQSECQVNLRRLNALQYGQALFVITDLTDHKRLRELSAAYSHVAISMGTTASSLDNFIHHFDSEKDSMSEIPLYFYLVSPSAELVYKVPYLRDDIDLKRELEHFQSIQ